jgi:hypothetical protein
MADLSSIRAALAATLKQGIPSLNTYRDFIAVPITPAAIIMPQPQGGLAFRTLDGAVDYALRIALLVTYGEDISSQTALDAYLSTGGPESVLDVIYRNPRLGGEVDFCWIETFRGYGLTEWAAQQYLGTNLSVMIMA